MTIPSLKTVSWKYLHLVQFEPYGAKAAAVTHDHCLNRAIREATGETGDADSEEMFLYLGKFPDVESAFEKYNSTMDANDTARVVCWDDPYDYCFRRRYNT